MTSSFGGGYKLLAIVLIVLQLTTSKCEVVQTFSLAKNWNVTNANGTYKFVDIQIPNGVYSLLRTLDPPQDILNSYNDVNLRSASLEDWIWTTEFDTPDSHASRSFVNLTFFGIDTVATITLNGKVLAETNNMFVRYSFNIKDKLSAKRNKLEVRIKSPVLEAQRLASQYHKTPPECPHPRYHGECHMNFLRKMQASFAWDWGLAAPSLGLWKTVLLEVHDVAIIRDIDVATSLLSDRWIMHVRVYLETGLHEPFYGELTMYAVDFQDKPLKIVFDHDSVDYRNPVIAFDTEIPKNDVKPWWPNGYGEPKLYPVHFSWNGRFSGGYSPELWSISQKSIRVGFRTIELVQKDLPNGNTFLFKVNGIEMFMKGSNWIPSHILPERSVDNDRIKYLLTAAKNANMNMLRVWGGGVYESDYFYDMADYYGILIWQDMMFACAMYPAYDEFLKSVEIETIQNALRIAHHPSIAIWATNNENEAALAQDWYKTNDNFEYYADNYRRLYVATIFHALKIIIHSGRPDPLISSPSNGVKSNESNFIDKNPQDNNYGDVHYYNYDFDGWNPVIYPKPRFASEYGFQSLPSMTSWYRIMASGDNLTDLIDHRQHLPQGTAPISILIKRHLTLPKESDKRYTEALIYLSQISQAMVTKTETEHYRSLRSSEAYTMGALYWQLNDVWIAPSWSSIDFHGTFKILQYWAKEFLAPLAVIAQVDVKNKVNVYVAWDSIENNEQNMTVMMSIILWSELLPADTISFHFSMEPNTVKQVTSFDFDKYLKGPFNIKNSFLQFELLNEEMNVLSTTYLFPTHLKDTVGIGDPEIEAKIALQTCDAPNVSVSLSIKVRRPALFVVLELTRTDIKKHTFSKNGFIQVIPIQTVHLEYEDANCATRPFKTNDFKVFYANIYV